MITLNGAILRVSNDLSFASNIGGVLVESGSSLKGTMSIRIFNVSVYYLNGCFLSVCFRLSCRSLP